MTDDETVTCGNCGEELPADDAVNSAVDVSKDVLETLLTGESVPVSELFAFDESYCSLDCATGGRDD